jgi:protein phosphatase
VSQPLAQDPDVLVAPPARESHVTQKRPQRIQIDAFGNTDVGLAREGNEDSFAVLHHLGLFMVADGVGGGHAGEVASRMALDCVREAFENPDMTWPAASGQRPEERPNASLLIAGLQHANSHILGISRRHQDKQGQDKQGMGTTFAGVLALDDRVVIAHVGDSRVYRLRERRLDLLTEDHSLLNAWIRAGAWDPADAAAFPYPNAITRAVGMEDQLEVDTRVDAARPGDVYLVCSDGLHGVLEVREIASVLLKHEDLTLAVERLIENANDKGGPDNITAVLARITGVGAR